MPSSSLFLRSSTTLVSALSLLSVSSAAPAPATQYYALDTIYNGQNFFDGFSFFSAADPTHGFVDYLSRNDAETAGLISDGFGQPARMKVDSSTTLPVPANDNKDGVGRKSVRIESTKRWTHGLIIADISHMPTSSEDGCGTWPAFWTLGSGTWPYNGEIDILEGANDQSKNFAAGHTGSADQTRQCTVNNNGGSGGLIYSNCNLYTTDPFGNPTNPTGCKIEVETPSSYGAPFNDNDGGIYAMEWTSDYIKTYFFPRSSIPNDIDNGEPDPTKWTPFGIFGRPGCDVDSNFNDMQIIFDTTFCGDFGDATWNSACAAKTGYATCAAYVASEPQDFSEAYWEIPSLKVYTLKDKYSTTTSSSTTTTSSTTTSWTTTTTSSTTASSITTTSSTTTSWPTTTTSSTTTSWPTTTTSSTTTSSTTTSSTTTSWPTSTSSTATTTSTSSSYSFTTPDGPTSSGPSSTASTTSTYSPTDHWPGSTTTSSSTDPSSKSSVSWEDWSSSTSSSSTADPSSTSTWADWSVDPTSTSSSTASTSYVSWEDWSTSTSSTPALSTSKSTYDPSYTWGDWESTSSTPAFTSTTTYDPSYTWEDWSTSSSRADPTTNIYTTVWGDWESSSTPAESTTTYDPSYTWADWQPASTPDAPAAGVTTVKVEPTPSIPAAAETGWSTAASSGSGSRVSPAGNGTSPYVAGYTGAATRNSISYAALVVVGLVALL